LVTRLIFFQLRAVQKQHKHENPQQNKLRPGSNGKIVAQPGTDKIYRPASPNREGIWADWESARKFRQTQQQSKFHHEVQHDDRRDQLESKWNSIFEAQSSGHDCPPLSPLPAMVLNFSAGEK